MGMRLLCAGAPLRLRARLAGELPDLDLDVVSSPRGLEEALQHQTYQALLLFEDLLDGAAGQLLDACAEQFHGAVFLVEKSGHKAEELRQMARSHRVVAIFSQPVQADELVRALVLELGLRRLAPPVRNSPPELDDVWRQQQPALQEALQALERLLQNPSVCPNLCEEASSGARRLLSNFGSFGLAAGGLLAREAAQLVAQAQAGGELRRERLGLVLKALERIVWERSGPEQPRLVLVSDDLELIRQLDMEARLLNWATESCSELSDLPLRLSMPQARVAVIDTRASSCHQHPELLREVIDDPFPTVVLSPSVEIEDSASARWLNCGSSPYAVMLAAIRAQLAPPREQTPMILVLDQDKVALAVMERALSLVDYHVESLSHPFDFWDMLESCRPDLVILSVELPTLSGLEICRAMRLDHRYQAIPVLLTSDMLDAMTCHKAYEAGADDFLPKPLDAAELRGRVSNRLERYRQASRQLSSPRARTFASLDQLVARSLHEGVPLLLARIELPHGGLPRQRLASALHAHLRGEDVVRPLGETGLLVAMLTPCTDQARRRLAQMLDKLEPEANLYYSSVSEQCPDLETALARMAA